MVFAALVVVAQPDHHQLRAAGHAAAPGRGPRQRGRGFIGIAEFYTGINITNYIHIPGLSPAVNVNSLLDRNGFNRPSSTATQPIEFGVVMAMLLPFALQQAFDPARTGRLRKWRR